MVAGSNKSLTILSTIDNPNYESYWTDWLYGLQFRFDNGPDEMPDKIILKNITFSDTTMQDIITVDLAYQSIKPDDFVRRPGFIYKIEFGSESNALETAPVSSCKDNGFPFIKEAAMAKLFSSETAMYVTTEAIQIHGGYGYIKDYNVERYFRDAKLLEIGEGTSEIQRIVISREILNNFNI